MATGRLIAHRFEIHDLAGKGGAASVYRATDRRSGLPVAVKLLRASPGADALRRFVREAELLSALSHPAAVRYVTHGHDQGELYLVMEWLDGVTLTRHLAQAALGIDEAVAVVVRVAGALAAAHARGIIHRDVKPSNIFLERGEVGRAKILDFGIARLLSSAAEITQSGTVIGTAGYMAPEQTRGDRALDARADVFSLGCVLYRCLAGRAPFGGSDVAAILAKVLLDDAEPLRVHRPDAPPALEQLVMQMLSKDPAARPADAAAVVAALEALGPAGDDDRPTTIKPALTGDERRISCVLMSRLSSHDGAASLDTLRARMAARGARSSLLMDGTLLVTLDGAGTDEAARAARCALVLRALAPGQPVVLAAGEAEVSGPSAIGPAIDRGAAWLAEGLPIVRVDEVIAGLLDRRFELRRDSGVLSLLGEREAPSAARTFLGKPSTCVGRRREIALLEGIWQECVEESVARIVLITGPAGAGKSRVVEELLRTLSATRSDAAVWSGHGDPMSARSPFTMIGQAIRDAAGIGPEPIDVRQRKLRERVGAVVEPAAAHRVTEFLAELVGLPFASGESVELRTARRDPVLMGDQLRRAWEDWLDAEAARRPIVIVLEDLHWGDLPSVRFVDAAARHLARRPLLVIAVARPEIYDWCPNIWTERQLTEVRLGRLGDKAAEQLVREAIDADTATIARIVARGDGNPFYLEELVRAHASGRGEALPETVLAMVQARLGRLSDAARRFLRAASVFGMVFRVDGVEALIGDGAASSHDALSELFARDMLARPADAGLRGHIGFQHALVHEAAYASLTQADRTLAHRLAAAWLEARGDADPVLLAEHLERAGELGRAIGYYRRAAEQALEGHDHQAAVERVDKAIACGARGEIEGALRLIESEARRWSGDNEPSRAAALQAMQALPKGGAGWCAAASELAAASGSLGDTAQLVALASALETVTPLDDASPLIDALARLARPLFWSGEHALARRVLARAVALEVDATDLPPTALAMLYMALGVDARLRGDPSECVRCNELAVAQSDRAGDLRGRAAALGNLGYAYLELGAHAEAERALSEALATAERLALPLVVATAQQNLGLALGRRGAFEEAMALERASHDFFASRGDPRRAGCSLLYLASIQMSAGQLDDAARTAQQAVELLAQHQPPRCHALALRAQIELLQGHTERGIASAEQAYAAFVALGSIDEGESRVRLVRAEALRAAGDVSGACIALAQAHACLMARAEHIADETRRRAFLDAIPENARTLSLSRAWGVSGDPP